MGGIGETFTPDQQTGVGQCAVRLELRVRRIGFHQCPALAYSTGNLRSECGFITFRARLPPWSA